MSLLWSVEQLKILLEGVLGGNVNLDNLIHKISFDDDNNIIIPHENSLIHIDQLTFDISIERLFADNPLLHEVRGV